jgi:hypothetical protein
MDDSSEILNSSNSNLRDLIVQKLSAAREQKLKQTRSTSTISNTSKLSPVPQTASSPDEERNLLLTLLEKSQSSASQSLKERKFLEQKIVLLSEQVERLSSENKDLKQELEKYLKRNPNARSEVLLIDELRKIEALSLENEKKHKEEIKSFNERIKNLLANQENSSKNEIVQMEEKLSNLFEVIKEKDKEIEKLKKLQVKPPNNEKVLTSNLNELKKEKEKIERNLERTLQMSCEKEAELSEEVLKQKTLLSLLQQQKDQREKELKSEITSLTQELKTLKTALKKTEFLLSEEKASFESEKHELILSYKMLQKDIKSSEAFSTFYTLRGDLQRAQETIASLESTLKMKDASLSQIDSQKNAKTSTSSETLSQIQKNFQDFYIRQKSSEDLHMSELLSKNEEISSLLNEIADLRHKILIFEKKKYENELVLVRADLHKAVAERSHAKRLLVAYVRSVQQLEKMLNRQVDLDDLENVFKEQVARLNEENKSLVEAKVKQGQFYEQEIKNLQEVIDGLHEKIQDYEMTVDSMRKIRVKENTEEIKSWIIKNKQLQELNKRIVEGFSLIDLNKSEGLIKKKMKDSVKIH